MKKSDQPLAAVWPQTSRNAAQRLNDKQDGN